MTRRRDPFTQALASLKTHAEQGVFIPGQPVVIVEEARRLRLSTTPVREALAWLCGFGLIERAPTGGYLAPRLDPAIVRDRLSFRLHCLLASLVHGEDSHDFGPDPEGHDTMAGRLSDHMRLAVKRTGNAALVEAYQRVSSQLEQLSGAEQRLFPDLEAEAERLVRLFERRDDQDLSQAITEFHQRRMKAAPLLVLEAEASRPTSAPDL